MKRLLLGLLAILFVSCVSSTAWWFSSNHKLPQVSLLRTQGTSIVDAEGNEVSLRGINIGSWLLIEPWMVKLDGQQGIDSEKDIWDLMEKRFGPQGKHDLIRTHRENFFTEADVRRIADLGLNCIRVPVWWRAVADPEYGGDFAWLDRCIQWCKRNGVYVIIDLHGAPGGQSAESRIVGERTAGDLWKDDGYRRQTVDWWKQVAERYRDEPAVAGYDLLNEAYAVDKMSTLAGFYDELYKAIRSVDPDHILFIQDGLLGFQLLPKPESMGWDNVVYSVHYYPKDTECGVADPSSFFYRFSRAGLYYGVPVNVGEFNSMQFDRGGISAIQRNCEAFDYFGWSWNLWSYKVLSDNRDYNWGLYGDSANPPPNLYHDSLESIRRAFESMRTESLNINPAMQAALAQPSRWPEADESLLTLDRAYILPDKDGQLRMEWGRAVPNVGFWAPRDRIGWVVDLPDGGVFELGIRYANSGSANRARIWVDGVQIADPEVPAAKNWTAYRDQALGVFSFGKGMHRIALEKADADSSFINLQHAWLRQASGPAEIGKEKGILLDAFNAEPFPPASPIRPEWLRNPVNLGYWRSSSEASWRVSVRKGGTYNGTLTYATPNDDSLFVVYINRKPLFNAWLKGTGGWHNYTELDMGALNIPPGDHAIDVKWDAANPEGAGNFGSVLLKKE